MNVYNQLTFAPGVTDFKMSLYHLLKHEPDFLS